MWFLLWLLFCHCLIFCTSPFLIVLMEAILLIVTWTLPLTLSHVNRTIYSYFIETQQNTCAFKEPTKNNAIYQSRIYGDNDGKKYAEWGLKNLNVITVCNVSHSHRSQYEWSKNSPMFHHLMSYLRNKCLMSWMNFCGTKCKECLISLIPRILIAQSDSEVKFNSITNARFLKQFQMNYVISKCLASVMMHMWHRLLWKSCNAY